MSHTNFHYDLCFLFSDDDTQMTEVFNDDNMTAAQDLYESEQMVSNVDDTCDDEETFNVHMPTENVIPSPLLMPQPGSVPKYVSATE